MENLLYKSLTNYYNILCKAGYLNVQNSYALVLLTYIQKVANTLSLNNEDVLLLNMVIRKLTDCFCVIPQNNVSLKSNIIETTPNEPDVIVPSKPTHYNSFYFGLTDTPPQEFLTKSVGELMVGTREIKVPNYNNYKVVVNQNKLIHYILIPSDIMDLVNSQFGDTFVTSLWDSKDNSGAYKTMHKGGEYNGLKYKVFFYYSPAGGFEENISITVKNKS